MSTFYSILYINLNTFLGEKISMGLFMSDGQTSFFRFSLEKLNALKEVIQEENYRFAKKYFQSIAVDLSTVKESLDFKDTASFRERYSERYFSYLSRYANNLIQFSNPQHIEINCSLDNFRKVYEKYIYAFSVEEKIIQEIDVFRNVKERLYPIINKNVNIDKEITNNDFTDLIIPVKVNFIGVNGLPVTGQAINFEKSHYHLENDISRYIALTKAIEINDKKGKYFVIGKEPVKINSDNHILWNDLKNSTFFDYVDISETEKVSDYILDNNVRPYFEELNLDSLSII